MKLLPILTAPLLFLSACQSNDQNAAVVAGVKKAFDGVSLEKSFPSGQAFRVGVADGRIYGAWSMPIPWPEPPQK